MRPPRLWAAALLSATLSAAGASRAAAQAPLPGFVDNGSYTTIAALGLDVHDVDAFTGRTFDEVLAQVQGLGGGWRLATIAEVSPIFGLLDEGSYLASARFLFGAAESTPDGTTRYLTGGRVVDEPGSPDPTWGWLWGFGTAVQMAGPGGPTYEWNAFGIGYDNKDARLDDMGAWVVRDAATAVPEPAALWLLGAGALMLLVLGRRARRRATA